LRRRDADAIITRPRTREQPVSAVEEVRRVIMVRNIEVELRSGTIADVPLLLSFIRSMAAFEKLTVSATEESLRDALFGEAPSARTLLASVEGQPIAYATYFFTFATMIGKRGLWLDDLFVDPAWRGKGIGRAIMAHLAQIALRHRCGRFEWMVLDWNDDAIGFYERLGATVLEDWRICRLDEAQLSRVAGPLPGRGSGPPPGGGSQDAG
jgi:GNAT superfamily N-acetyltransferase